MSTRLDVPSLGQIQISAIDGKLHISISNKLVSMTCIVSADQADKLSEELAGVVKCAKKQIKARTPKNVRKVNFSR